MHIKLPIQHQTIKYIDDIFAIALLEMSLIFIKMKKKSYKKVSRNKYEQICNKIPNKTGKERKYIFCVKALQYLGKTS